MTDNTEHKEFRGEEIEEIVDSLRSLGVYKTEGAPVFVRVRRPPEEVDAYLFLGLHRAGRAFDLMAGGAVDALIAANFTRHFDHLPGDGREYIPGETPELDRKILSGLLHGLAGYPSNEALAVERPVAAKLFSLLAHALDALEYGGAPELLKPGPKGPRKSHITLLARSYGLAFVAYWMARGPDHRKGAALRRLEPMTDIWNDTVESAQKWDRNVPESMRAHHDELLRIAAYFGKRDAELDAMESPAVLMSVGEPSRQIDGSEISGFTDENFNRIVQYVRAIENGDPSPGEWPFF